MSDYCLMLNEQYFSHIMVRTSYILMRWWWCPLCTWPTSWVFIVLSPWNNSLWVDTSSLLLIYSAVHLVEKQQIPIWQLLIWPDLGLDPWYTTLETIVLIITPSWQFTSEDHLMRMQCLSYVVHLPWQEGEMVHNFEDWQSTFGTPIILNPG